jgi:hypothetical protein
LPGYFGIGEASADGTAQDCLKPTIVGQVAQVEGETRARPDTGTDGMEPR